MEYVFGSVPNIVSNTVPAAYVVSRTANVQLVFSNWSLFAQDTWNITRNLTITYGLRWEYNAAPSSPNGTLPFTVTQVNNLATMTLAPAGTPLWHPQKDDFAPRLGIAWRPLPNLVIRAGAGIFYDLGYSDVADGMDAFPYGQEKLILGTSFPLSAAAATPPPFTTSPPVDYLAVVDPNHFLPRTYEWNAAVEQGLGRADVFSITYVGAAGRKLMRQDLYDAPNPEFTGEFDLMRNGATSSYQSLQAQYRHRLAHGLQALLSYTWSHSIDDVSSDVYFVSVPPGVSPSSQERGPSDYDIRNTFAGAVSYDIPGPGSGVWKSILGHWSTDSIIYARSAMPVNVVTGLDPFDTGFLSGAYGVARPDLIPGVATLPSRLERRRRKDHQRGGIQHTQHGAAGRPGTQCPARIRRDATRYDAAQAVPDQRPALAAGARGPLQHLQPPQLWNPDKLPEFSPLRAIDADAE